MSYEKTSLERSKRYQHLGIVQAMTAPVPRIWFERPIHAAHVADVAGRVVELGPAAATPDDPLSGLATAQGAVASAFDYDDAVFDRAPELLAVGRTGIGYDTVNLESATRHGVAVVNIPTGPTISTAEQTVGLMLAAAKSIKPSEEALRAGGQNFYERHVGVELAGKTLGLVGFGRIPRRVAKVAAALEMNVVAYDKFATDFDGLAEQKDTVEAVISEADVVSVHVPSTPETVDMFNDDLFGQMKRGVVFVNTARGAVVDIPALERALDSGRVFAAGLDVTNPEPLPPEHSLLKRSNVIVTPHVAAGTPEAKYRNFFGALDQVIQVISGERPPHLVNPDVWPAVLARLDKQEK